MNRKGFTLVELIVVMGMFIVIMMVISSSFGKILNTAGQQVKSAETSTEGIVGLEMLRSDIEHAGFGLFWAFPPGSALAPFSEMTDSPVGGVDYLSLNDAIPRAVVVQTTPALSAYLVIKSTRVALHDTAKKWSYVDYQGGGGSNTSFINDWNGSPENLVQGETVVTLNSTFTTTGVPNKVLAMAGNNYSYSLTANPPVEPSDIAYKPKNRTQLFIAYGVEPAGGSTLSMPYNRADYYIRRPPAGDPIYKMPETCNPYTGILFKGVVRHLDRKLLEYPLMSCVGDMQVEFELGSSDNSVATSFLAGQLFGGDASAIRDQLKTVYVYILAHEGKKDTNYVYPRDSIQVGDSARPNTSGLIRDSIWMGATFGTDWKNYRWKIYTIAVHPKNLD